MKSLHLPHVHNPHLGKKVGDFIHHQEEKAADFIHHREEALAEFIHRRQKRERADKLDDMKHLEEERSKWQSEREELVHQRDDAIHAQEEALEEKRRYAEMNESQILEMERN